MAYHIDYWQCHHHEYTAEYRAGLLPEPENTRSKWTNPAVLLNTLRKQKTEQALLGQNQKIIPRVNNTCLCLGTGADTHQRMLSSLLPTCESQNHTSGDASDKGAQTPLGAKELRRAELMCLFIRHPKENDRNFCKVLTWDRHRLICLEN